MNSAGTLLDIVSFVDMRGDYSVSDGRDAGESETEGASVANGDGMGLRRHVMSLHNRKSTRLG